MVTIQKRSDGVPFYTLDEFISVVHPIQNIFRIVYFKFKRDDGLLKLTNIRFLTFGVILIISDIIGSIVKYAILMNANKVYESQEVLAILSIESLNFLRGVFLLFSSKRIEIIYQRVDSIFPDTLELQEKLRLPEMAERLRKRFNYLYTFSWIALLVYMIVPYAKYFLFYKTNSGEPVGQEFHQLPSWEPFGIKDNYHYYHFIYFIETYLVLVGIAVLSLYDVLFTTVLSFLVLQFEFLGRELAAIDARKSHSQNEIELKIFYRHLWKRIAFLNTLNRMIDEVNDVFKLPIIVTDMIAAVSICFFLYLISNTTDIIAIGRFAMPCSIMVFFTYDCSKCGTDLEEATSNIKDIIYNTNWYEGSIHYRKQVIRLLQQANNPYRLTGFNVFDVNMMHFQKMMMLSYQMLTFLKSQK